jgi:signal peptidase I
MYDGGVHLKIFHRYKGRFSMATINEKFIRLKARYRTCRSASEDMIASWEDRGYNSQVSEGRALLEKADALEKSISAQIASGDASSALAGDVKVFKTIVKELVEMAKSPLRQWVEAIVVALFAVIIIRNFFFGLYHVPSGSAEPTLLVGDRVWGNKFAYRLGAKPQKGEYIMVDNPEFKYDKSNILKQWWQKYAGFPIPLFGLPAGPDNWTKRIIAEPGDMVEGRVEDGQTVVYVNGEKIEESYLNPHPLIGLRKSTGFVDSSFLRSNPLLSWMAKTEFAYPVFYTYDHTKSLEEQPYYDIEESEILSDPTKAYGGQPWLKFPRDPSLNMYGRNLDVFGPFKVPEGKYWVMGDSRRNSKDSRAWGFLDESLIHGRVSFIIYSVDSQEPFWFFELLKHPINFWTKKVRWNRFFKMVY